MTIAAKPDLAAVRPYRQGRSTIAGHPVPIKLSANELPYPPAPAALTALRDTGDTLSRYPDGQQTALRAAIADLHGVPADNIFAANGSEEAIGLIIRALLSPGDEMIVSRHSFAITAIYARSVGASVVTCPETGHCVDVDAMRAAVTGRTRIVYLCTPNNPTGTYTEAAALHRLAAGLPDHVLLLVDAAYAEFADRPDYDCGLQSLFGPQARVAVTRTFSKAYGLAALRIGWAAVPDRVMDAVARIRSPFNANMAAQNAARAALLDQDHLRDCVARVRRTRARFTARLRDLGLTVLPSQANFVLILFPAGSGHAHGLDAALQAAGILGRPVADAADEYRISIGTDGDMDKVAGVVERWTREARPGDLPAPKNTGH